MISKETVPKSDYGWSRSVLTHQIASGLRQREGKAISNLSGM